MVNEAEARDIVAIATALLGVYGKGGSRVPESLFAPDEVDFPLSCEVELKFDTESVATVVAVLATFKLSVEAAAVVLAYVAETEHVSGSELEPARLQQLAIGAPMVGLELTYIGDGSFLSRWTLNPRTKDGRKHLLQLAGLAALGLGFVVTEGAVVVGIKIGIKVLDIANDVFTKDDVQTLRPKPAPRLESVAEAPPPDSYIEATILPAPLPDDEAEVEAAELARQAAVAEDHELEQHRIEAVRQALLRNAAPRIVFRT